MPRLYPTTIERIGVIVFACATLILMGVMLRNFTRPAPAPIAQQAAVCDTVKHGPAAPLVLRRGDVIYIPFKVRTFTPDGKTTVCELVREAK